MYPQNSSTETSPMIEQVTVEDLNECFQYSRELLQSLAFIPFAFGSTVCNTILVASILFDGTLRNRGIFRIICALAFAEWTEAFATLLGGTYRTVVIILRQAYTSFTPLQCMLLPHSWMWRWSDFATAFMELSVTVDRLLSVLTPLRYMSYGTRYSTVVIGIAYGLSALFSLGAWHKPLFYRARLSMLCLDSYISTTFYAFSKFTSTFACILSVVLYLPVVYLTRKQLKNMSGKIANTQIDSKHRAQLHMSVTLAIQCLSTFLLDAVPRSVGISAIMTHKEESDGEKECASPLGMLFHLTKLNSMIAFGLYYWRNEIIRQSLSNLFRMKTQAHAVAFTSTYQRHRSTVKHNQRKSTLPRVHPLPFHEVEDSKIPVEQFHCRFSRFLLTRTGRSNSALPKDFRAALD